MGWKTYIVIGLLGLGVVAEFGLRFGVGLGDPPLARLDDATEYELIPDGQYSRWGNEISINSHGLRAPDHAVELSENERRILLIGDSVIYGNHFLDQSQTIAALGTDMLRSAPGLGDCTPLVLPMAVSSWGPFNQNAFLKREGSFGAQVTGIVVSGHDLYDVPKPTPDILPYRLKPSMTAIFDAFTGVYERYARKSAVPDPRRNETRAQISLVALEDIITMLRAAGSIPVLFYHPTRPERANGLAAEHDVFKAKAAEWDVPFEVILPDDPLEGSYRDDIHPNAQGAEKMADYLMKVLSPLLTPCS